MLYFILESLICDVKCNHLNPSIFLPMNKIMKIYFALRQKAYLKKVQKMVSCRTCWNGFKNCGISNQCNTDSIKKNQVDLCEITQISIK